MSICSLKKDEAKELESLIEGFRQARDALDEFLNDIAIQWRDDFAEKSERWQKSDIGLAARDRLDELQSAIDDLPDTPSIGTDALTAG